MITNFFKNELYLASSFYLVYIYDVNLTIKFIRIKLQKDKKKILDNL